MAVRPVRLLTAIMTVALLTSFGLTAFGQTNVQTPGGVEIDASGVLSLKTMQDQTGVLDRQRALAARESLPKDLQRVSELRKVSLTRLEKAVRATLDAGQPLPDDMLQMAGLTRITHVFVYPDNGEIVIAGPAEGFYHNGQNTTVGLESGDATLNLEDFVVALRAFAPGNDQTGVISCSIDPTAEGLARLQQTLQQIGGVVQPGQEMQVAQAVRNSLGMQTITVAGIPAQTRMARVLVEADYQMKMIGIGLIQPVAKIRSYVAGVSPVAVSQNALIRWYFQPNYDCVHVNSDRTAMQLVGSGVKLVGEDERVASNGNRQGTGKTNRASRDFCRTLTEQYDQLGKVMPVFGELRNVVDMNIVAAFLQKSDAFGRTGWAMETFADEKLMPTERFNAPRQVPPVMNAMMKDGLLMTPIGGGVSIQPRYALNSDQVQEEKNGEISEVRDSAVLSGLANDQWWWD